MLSGCERQRVYRTSNGANGVVFSKKPAPHRQIINETREIFFAKNRTELVVPRTMASKKLIF